MLAICASGLAAAQAVPQVNVTTAEGEGGVVVLTMENHYTQPMTAYAYDCSFQSYGSTVTGEEIKDSAIYENPRPVMPGDQAIVRHGGPGILDVVMTFRAAVFADGAGTGDPRWIQRIWRQREVALEEIHRQLARLSAARDGAADLVKLAEAIRTDREARLAAVQNQADDYRMVEQLSGWLLHNLDAGVARGDSAESVIQSFVDMVSPIRAKLEAALAATRQRE